MPSGKVGVHFIKAGGFRLRLKAGSIGHAAERDRWGEHGEALYGLLLVCKILCREWR